MTSSIGIQRLETLANYLRESVPDSQFDMGTWVGPNWKGAPDLSCGTNACALGWATTIPAFRRAGLVLVRNRNDGYNDGGASGHVELHYGSTNDIGDSIEAASVFFDITQEQASELFGGTGPNDRRAVADRIDLLAKYLNEFGEV